MDFIPIWANAVAQFEGFGANPSNRPSRNHNPGNLKFAGQPGAIGRDPNNFAVFSDDAAGFQALYRQLQKYVKDFPNDSILQITARYLGQAVPTVDAEGNAFTYATFVAGQLGVDPGTTLGQLASGVAADVSNLIFPQPSASPISTPTGESNGESTIPDLVLLSLGGILIFWLINRVFGGP